MITDDEMETVALWHHALVMQETLGMKGFANHHYQAMTPRQQRIIEQFERLRMKTADELATMAEEDPDWKTK